MKERHSYKGVLNGINGVWSDKKPRGLKEVETITFYVPDEDKIFKKGDEYFTSVVIKDDINIEDYEEVAKPEEPKEEENGETENEVRDI